MMKDFPIRFQPIPVRQGARARKKRAAVPTAGHPEGTGIMRPLKARICAMLVLFAAATCLSFLFCDTARAESASHKITIKPMMTLSAKHDSNFYGDEKNEQGVYSFMIQPGFRVGLELPKTSLDFAYMPEAYTYTSSSSEEDDSPNSSDLDYIGHLLSLSIRHQRTDHLAFGLDNGFYVTRYPYFYDRLSTTIDNQKYWTNRLSPYVFYDFRDRFTLGLRFNWRKIVYDDDDEAVHETGGDYSGDSDEYRWIVSFGMDPTRTTTIDLDYQFWELEYDDERLAGNYSGQWIMATGQKRFKYFALDAGIGFNWQDYEDGDLEDQSTVTYKFGITGQDPPPAERRRHLGKVFIRPINHFYLGYVRNANTYGSYYTADRFILSLGGLFWDRIDTQARGWYQIGDYKSYTSSNPEERDKKRKDKTYDISLRMAYVFTESLSLSLTGGRTERDSNLEGYSYVNDYVILSADFNYDLGARGGFTREALFYW